MDNLPFYIYFVFGLTLLLAVLLFYKATKLSKVFLITISVWIVLQSILSQSGFYRSTNKFPPRLPFLLLPPIILITTLFNTKKGKYFIDSLNIKILSIFHIIRIPVELVLFWLFMYKSVPQLMTFEGRNFDIFSGLSAPFIYYFGFSKNKLSNKTLVGWNFICLALVINIAINGILSATTTFQQFAFEQPNIAIQYFPFALLPSVIVPLVIFSHLVSIRQLLSIKILK
ncbi:hypothetical protein [Parasediminibacterium sp. JCM 36343]|uniref:hypothetical protein n=1 Tax=Parasediminibacterium sp. JCM 36343 TaxID=3374279 RepID=UPI00397C7E55